MKSLKKVSLVLILIVSSLAGFSQNFGYVDSEYILENIPEYKDAQDELDKLSKIKKVKLLLKIINFKNSKKQKKNFKINFSL